MAKIDPFRKVDYCGEGIFSSIFAKNHPNKNESKNSRICN
jgi:hypothetical protein